MGHYIDDLEVFNPLLTEWLIEILSVHTSH